jgi:ABC-type iron transport system FetAB ATPase subunit
MMKESTRRKRTRQEMMDVKDLEQSLKEDKQTFLREAKRLKNDKETLQRQVEELSHGEELLRRLYDMGVVDEHGNPLPR